MATGKIIDRHGNETAVDMVPTGAFQLLSETKEEDMTEPEYISNALSTIKRKLNPNDIGIIGRFKVEILKKQNVASI